MRLTLGTTIVEYSLVHGGGGAVFVPGSVPKVHSSVIPRTGDGIMVTFDRPMHATASLQDAITVTVNGKPAVKADHVLPNANNPAVLGFMFPANFFKFGDVVTWAYNDQHPTEELKGAETGGVEIDNQTYGVRNTVLSHVNRIVYHGKQIVYHGKVVVKS